MDIQMEAELAEHCMGTACKFYRDRAAEIPMARFLSSEAIDEAIQALQDAKLAIRMAHQRAA